MYLPIAEINTDVVAPTATLCMLGVYLAA